MFTKKQIEELVDLLLTLDNSTKIYLGCDSVRFVKDGRKFARYATVAIVHMNGNKGCKIFSAKSIEPDFDVKKHRPSIRLMNEVMKVCELYNQLAPFIDEFDCSIHLDINTNPVYGSNCVATQAAGYVLGVTGLTQDKIKLKPEAWCASFGADWAVHNGDI
jgi:uncharacterized protein